MRITLGSMDSATEEKSTPPARLILQKIKVEANAKKVIFLQNKNIVKNTNPPS